MVGPDGDPRLSELRSRGVAAVAVSDPTQARAYAASWGFAFVWEDTAERKTTTDEVVRVLSSNGKLQPGH